jgi:tripartite-type tricarboxylate transporter receptor subunit TctC
METLEGREIYNEENEQQFYISNHTRGCVMREKIRSMLIIIGIIGLWIFLRQGIDLAEAKDPDYPTKPITFIISYGPGGTLDTASRALIEAVGKYLGQPIIPINKPGGGATLGAMAVMNAKPDGYTLGAFVGTHVLVLPHTEDCPYRDLSGFSLIMNFTNYVLPVIVRSDAPYKTWKEFIEWARQNPRAVKFVFPSAKSQCPQGVAMWQVEQKERVEITYIVMPSAPEALSAILGGHVNAEVMAYTPTKMQYIKEGKLRVLTYFTKDKIPGYEDIPSIEELYGIETPTFTGIWGPKGLPNYVLEKLDDAFAKGVKDPNFIDITKRMSVPIVYMNRAEVNRIVSEAYPKVGAMIKILRAEEAKQNK